MIADPRASAAPEKLETQIKKPRRERQAETMQAELRDTSASRVRRAKVQAREAEYLLQLDIKTLFRRPGLQATAM